MNLNQPRPILNLVTSGTTTSNTSPDSEDFSRLLRLIETAVAADIQLIQIREKRLSARTLWDLASKAAALTRGSSTKLLVNDRADIARSAGADGVQLTTQSLPTRVIRETFGPDFLIGVSTHSITEARDAKAQGADFVLFGPVFETESKKAFGEPQGLEKLKLVVLELDALPVIAIGGISLENAGHCLRAGAAGVAAIRMFEDPGKLSDVVATMRVTNEPRLEQHDGTN